jgi:hypothetical protein
MEKEGRSEHQGKKKIQDCVKEAGRWKKSRCSSALQTKLI